MRKLVAIVTAAMILSTTGASALDTLFVSSAAIGPGDGRSWESAYPTLQMALSVAISSDEIWVAQGTYLVGAEGLNIPSGVALYGGFTGDEYRREQRNWILYPTCIGPLPDPSPMITLTRVSSATIMDGFVVKGATNRAMLIDGGAPRIQNCVFESNMAIEGGAILVVASDSAEIRYCRFIRNGSDVRGGAIAITDDGDQHPSLLLISNCAFDGNTTGGSGGAISNTGSGSVARIQNCVFAENDAEFTAGAVFTDGGRTYLSYCTFVDNRGSSPYVNAQTLEAAAPGALTLRNSIVWDGVTHGKKHIYIRNSEGRRVDLLLRANVVKGDTAFAEWQQDPLFKDLQDPRGRDGLLGTIDDGLTLQEGSPYVDKGVDDLIEQDGANDITMLPRSAHGTSDIGAYERQRATHIQDLELVDQLRTGTLTLVFVHAMTDKTGTDAGPGGLCPDEINLSHRGRLQARVAGSYLFAVCPPPSLSFSGTTCRTWETAQLLAGYSTKRVEWDGGGGDAELVRQTRLRTPASNGPVVIVADASVIAQHFGIQPSELNEGDAIVVRSNGSSYSALSHVTADGWSRLNLISIATSVEEGSGTSRRDMNWSVRPNPASEEIEIISSGASVAHLFTIVGVHVGSYSFNGSTTIDVSHLAPGPYVVTQQGQSSGSVLISIVR